MRKNSIRKTISQNTGNSSILCIRRNRSDRSHHDRVGEHPAHGALQLLYRSVSEVWYGTIEWSTALSTVFSVGRKVVNNVEKKPFTEKRGQVQSSNLSSDGNENVKDALTSNPPQFKRRVEP